MDFNEEISMFLCNGIGAVTIMDVENSNLICHGMENVEQLIEGCPVLELNASPVEWEFLDFYSKKYYKCSSVRIEKEGRQYDMHLHTDITEYMSLNRDVTRYMSFFKKLSAFQTAILERLSNTYYELMPMLVEYFKAQKSYFMIQRNDKLDIITYDGLNKIFENDRIEYNEAIEKVFLEKEGFGKLLNRDVETDELLVLCVGNAMEQNYAIVFPMCDKLDRDSMSEKTLINVIKLFIENTMLREKLLYASEHDSLTGLYNKGKYLSMVEQDFPNMESIAVFNFDVNDLKIMNDTYGHEAGDKLLIKAADSIRKVVNNKIYGFRMGGDEFLMVATNVTEDEVLKLKERWEEELLRLNELQDGINCVIAAGVAYGRAPYDFNELSKRADELMYEDKKLKKGGREIR